MSIESTRDGIDVERLGEACGVFGIYAPDQPVPMLAYLGIEAINHRGQQGAGISTSNGESLLFYKDKGLVKEAFNYSENLQELHGNNEAISATGHTWYGTSETPHEIQEKAFQPMLFQGEGETPIFAFSHNGDVKDTSDAAEYFKVDVSNAVSDSEEIKEILGAAYLKFNDITEACIEVMQRLKGAYSCIISTADEMIGVRDKNGFRPLHLGRMKKGQGGWVLASELPALRVIDAEPIREIEPGEIITISGPGDNDIKSTRFADADPAGCYFEFSYFSRPDNEFFEQSVYKTRKRMGELLAVRDKVEADIVVGVPNSGTVAALGYSWARRLPNEMGIVKNQYVDRTFIAREQERLTTVRKKLNADSNVVAGKRLIVVDDSVVRGTTQRELTRMLREAGATEIHLRLTSMPYKNPCIYGMDTGRPDELIAGYMNKNEIRDYLGVDSIEYLTENELQESLGVAAGKVCTACATGIYPSEVPVNLLSRIS